MLKHMLTQGGGPQAATVNGGGGVGGTRMAATATVVGIPSVEVSEFNDVPVPLCAKSINAPHQAYLVQVRDAPFLSLQIHTS